MTEEEIKTEVVQEPASPFAKHRFLTLVGASIMISFVFVTISLALYNSSGAAQLDLSRPGYKSADVKKDTSPAFQGYSSSGSVSAESLYEFEKTYAEQAKGATAVDAFSGDVLDPKVLGIAPDELPLEQ